MSCVTMDRLKGTPFQEKTYHAPATMTTTSTTTRITKSTISTTHTSPQLNRKIIDLLKVNHEFLIGNKIACTGFQACFRCHPIHLYT